MNEEIKNKWVKALRSGKYKQGFGGLRTGTNKYCCLGVLCDLHRLETGKGKWIHIASSGPCGYTYEAEESLSTTALPFCVRGWCDLDGIPNPKAGEKSLAEYNDEYVDFNEIANIIEKHL